MPLRENFSEEPPYKKPLQVGKSWIYDKTQQKRMQLKYSSILWDTDGFNSDTEIKPIPGDLMYLRRSNDPRPINGWWSGKKWEGLRLKPTDNVTAWKRNFEDDRAID